VSKSEAGKTGRGRRKREKEKKREQERERERRNGKETGSSMPPIMCKSKRDSEAKKDKETA